MTSVSLIATVLNEGHAIKRLLQSLRQQTTIPDEIIIVDGGSTDETLSILESYKSQLPLKILSHPGCNISEGRNIAIQAAQYDIIVATDAGVKIPETWLAALLAPFNADVVAVAGFFLPDPAPNNPFEVAMSATVLPHVSEIDPATFLPSSRSVAFRKSAWATIGGYPEWLDYSEDLVFDIRIKDFVGDFAFAPRAVVYFKPRTSVRSFFKQYYLYARGDGKADLWRKRHAIRYITYLVVVPLVLLLALVVHPVVLGLYIVGGAIYLKQPLQRFPALATELTLPQKLLGVFYIPLIRIVGDVAKMLGYPVGLQWRRQHNPPDWRQL